MKPGFCEGQWQNFRQVQWDPNVTVTNNVSFCYKEANLTVSCHQKCVFPMLLPFSAITLVFIGVSRELGLQATN